MNTPEETGKMPVLLTYSSFVMAIIVMRVGINLRCLLMVAVLDELAQPSACTETGDMASFAARERRRPPTDLPNAHAVLYRRQASVS